MKTDILAPIEHIKSILNTFLSKTLCYRLKKKKSPPPNKQTKNLPLYQYFNWSDVQLSDRLFPISHLLTTALFQCEHTAQNCLEKMYENISFWFFLKCIEMWGHRCLWIVYSMWVVEQRKKKQAEWIETELKATFETTGKEKFLQLKC